MPKLKQKRIKLKLKGSTTTGQILISSTDTADAIRRALLDFADASSEYCLKLCNPADPETILTTTYDSLQTSITYTVEVKLDPKTQTKENTKINLHTLLDTAIPCLEEDDLSKSRTTASKKTETPDNVQLWDDFEAYFERFNEIVDNCTTDKYQPVDVASIFRNNLVCSHNQLQHKIINLMDGIFKQIYTDIIEFEFTPNQQNACKLAELVGTSASINNGDLFYRLNDSTHRYLMEVKTSSTLHQKESLVDIFNRSKALIEKEGDPEEIKGAKRVENLIKQVFGYMRKEANNSTRYMFSLVSSYELTYVLFLDNGSDVNTRSNDESVKAMNLFISPVITKDKLLRAICFVLAMRYECILNEKKTSKKIQSIRNDVLKKFEVKNKSLPKSSNGANSENDSNSANVGNIQAPQSLQARILRAWRADSGKTVIGRGRTGFVVKLDLDDGESLALKMVDVFKHAHGAIDELENEYKVLQFLKEKNFSYAPQVRDIMTISVYRTIVMQYISGVKYDDFCEVSKDSRRVCLDVINELHYYKVTHGDLEPRNFIFPKGCTWPILIDFGRACINADQIEIDTEYKNFSESLCLPIETIQAENQSINDDDDSVSDKQDSLILCNGSPKQIKGF